MSLKKKLSAIVGEENVSDDAAELEKLAADRSFSKPIPPRYVVKAHSGGEVEAIVKLANWTGTPIIPVSSGGPHYRGDTVPGVPEAVILDLSGMKKILSVNKVHRMAVVEPGVTYGELAEALEKEGLALAPCLAPRATKSVVASALELEPRLNAVHQWAYTDPLRCVEVTWGDGNRMFTGEAGGSAMDLEQQWREEKWQVEPVGPMMLDFFRLLTASQGTMGVVTWASVRCELAHQAHRSFFVPAKSCGQLADFIFKVIRLRFSDELFVLNAAQLAALIGSDAAEIAGLRETLPAWTAMVGVGGRDLLPEMRCAQQEADITDIAREFGLEMLPAAAGVPADRAMSAAKGVCGGPYWKERAKGAFQDIFFTTTLDRTPEFVGKMFELARLEGVPGSDIGVYIQPLHCGSAYHVEFTVAYDPRSALETRRAKTLFDRAGAEFGGMNAFYSRPYGKWAEIQMNKDAMGKKALDKLKDVFDPNRIMNPGKLCL